MDELKALLNYLKVCDPYQQRYSDIKSVERIIKIIPEAKKDPLYNREFKCMGKDRPQPNLLNEYFVHMSGEGIMRYEISNRGNIRSYKNHVLATSEHGKVSLRISINPTKYKEVNLKKLIALHSHKFDNNAGVSSGLLY